MDLHETHDTVTMGEGDDARVYQFPRTPRPQMSDDDFRALEREERRAARRAAGSLRLVANAMEQGDVAKADAETGLAHAREQRWRQMRHDLDTERLLRAAVVCGGAA